MLQTPLKRARFKYRMLLKPKTVRIAGLRFCTDTALITKDIRKALYREGYERDERELVVKAVRPGDRVLEIGAGVGHVSVVCARLCGPENLISYEPNAAAAEVIKLNFALNGMQPQLRVRAVAAKGGMQTFYMNPNIYSSSLIDREGAAAQPVPCDAIADVVAEFRPNVILMDAEGAEIDLLPAADLTGIDKLILELHPHIVGEDKIDALIDWLRQQGFEIGDARRGKVYYFSRS